MHSHTKRATVTRRKLLLYVFGIFIAATISGNVSGVETVPNVPVVNEPAPTAKTTRLDRRIAAFKKGDVEKKINTNHYDMDGVIKYAKSLIGTPHVMGGYSKAGIDCSGLIALAHAKYGVKLPRSSHDQARYGTIISKDEKLKRGDIVFFHSTYKKNHLITHTGIYLGDNKFIHTSSKRGVTISTLRNSGYYEDHYLFATRLVD